jgi:PAS domain-containing protein
VLAQCHGEDLRVLLHSAVRHLRRQEPFDVECRLLGGDGVHRWFRSRGVAVRDASGRAVRMVGALIDVHDRRIASDTLMRLSELLEESQQQAEVGGWEYELESDTLSWTRETYRIHDLPPFSTMPTVEQAIGFYTPESQPVIRGAVEAAIRTGATFSHELELVTAKGRRIWVRATGRAVREGERTVRIHGAFQDITDRKMAAVELLRAKEAAESSSRAKSAFLAAMSHEIRTPMHAVLGYAAMLRETPLSDEQREYADVIARSGTALLRLIDDILDFSKVEAGKLALDSVPLDLVQVAVRRRAAAAGPGRGEGRAAAPAGPGVAVRRAGRSGARAAGAAEPGRQRAEVHAARGGVASASARSPAASGASRWSTPASASRRPSRPGCSASSNRSTTRPGGSTAAPGSGSRSVGA